jgi:hypothetical protein
MWPDTEKSWKQGVMPESGWTNVKDLGGGMELKKNR